jgi:imidazolonepropionase-like amidohydrolase
VINAEGQYLLPAFGDYHTHAFTYSNVEAISQNFLSNGIFYSQDLANDPIGRLSNRSYLDQKHTIDVNFANGCITSSYGHPIEGYERMVSGKGWPKNEEERIKLLENGAMEGRAYYILDEEKDIESVMNRLLATQPDVVKVILWDSENYNPNNQKSNKGINPKFLSEIVNIAKEHDLEVVAHTETEYDIEVSIKAGIKQFAHVPFYGYGINGKVNKDYPTLANAFIDLINNTEGIILNPTIYRTLLNIKYLPKSKKLTEEQGKLLKAFHIRLLSDLKSTNAIIAMGADSPQLNALDEAIYFESLEVFSNTALINMLINNGNLIYPDRKIGRIEKGYEANFFLVKDHPLKDLSAFKAINILIKNGNLIHTKS